MIAFIQRLTRPTVAFAHDIVMAALSFVISLYLRLGDLSLYSWEFLGLSTGLFTTIAGAVFWRLDIHRGIWRYASLNDLFAIARAATLVILLFLAAMFVTTRLDDLPRALVFINWFVLMILLAAPRILYRRVKDGRLSFTFDPTAEKRVPVLLIGAGDIAETFIDATQRRSSTEYRVVGILDDSPGRIGRFIGSVEVLGRPAELATVVERLKAHDTAPQRLVVTNPTFSGSALSALVDQADQLGIAVARLPRLTELRAAEIGKIDVRPIAIEDLLGRPQTVLDRVAMRTFVEGRRVLVTGAGGTIGGELVRQIADLGPSQLLLLDNSEFNLYSIDLELGERAPSLSRATLLCDVRDGDRMAAVFAELRPNVVFHAAALKHVPMMEMHPCEGVLTNVLGTRNVADACHAYGTDTMVLISTDKAVNPTSVMGASKRLAEGLCQALDMEKGTGGKGTRFITVRFGNVLGSTGSVVPLFRRQLASGGPLTVTHPEITRYFMTVREAVELVLQASALGSASQAESGSIYVLDMGEPIRIVDLARRMIRLAGLRPDRDIQIVFSGLRPGEKLNEELFHAAERLQPTAMTGILKATPRVADHVFLRKSLEELNALARRNDTPGVLRLLNRLVPEYSSPPLPEDGHAALKRPPTAV